MIRAFAILTTLGLSACSFSPSGATGTGDGGGDGPSAIDASDTPIDVPPIPVDACEQVCVADNVQSCGFVVEACAAGCSTTGGVHCKQLIPSNGANAADDLEGADAELALLDNRLYILDTDTGEIRHFPLDGSGGGSLVRAAATPGLDPVSRIRWRTATQTTPPGSVAPPELSIFGLTSLSVPSGAIVRPVGSRAAVIVTRGAIVIAGEVDVGGGRVQSSQGAASVITPGPGGGRGAIDLAAGNVAQGCAAAGNGTRIVLAGNQQRDTGGGGGGFGTAGGKGGRASGTQDGGGTAVAIGSLAGVCAQSNMVPLRGGSGGGCGQGTNDGGGGGGALQLTSLTSITINGGTLYAGGAGGDGTLGADGGGGGGSGGGLFLEAPVIAISGGSLTATGGGGGAGVGNTAVAENGQRDGTAAEPTGNGGHGATGGGGGAGEFLAEDGAGELDGTGGGGGGAGVIHLRSVSPPMLSGGPIIHPTQTTSAAAVAP